MELDFSEQIKKLFVSKAEKICTDCDKPMSKCACDTSEAKKPHPDVEDKKDTELEKGIPNFEKKEESEKSETKKASMNPMSMATPKEEEEEDDKDSENSEDSEDEENQEYPMNQKAKNKVKAYLEAKILKHNENHDRQISLAQLQEVFVRGSKTFENNHRIGVSRNQWAFARVNSFLKLVSDQNVNISYAKADSDILTSVFDSKNFEFSDFSEIEFQLAKISVLECGLSQSEASEVVSFAAEDKKKIQTKL